MKADILIIRTRDNKQVSQLNFPNEDPAQDRFDQITEEGNEHYGLFQFDLVVHHPIDGKLVRRTMYLNAFPRAITQA